jgi:hypothetical protein
VIYEFNKLRKKIMSVTNNNNFCQDNPLFLYDLYKEDSPVLPLEFLTDTPVTNNDDKDSPVLPSELLTDTPVTNNDHKDNLLFLLPSELLLTEIVPKIRPLPNFEIPIVRPSQILRTVQPGDIFLHDQNGKRVFLNHQNECLDTVKTIIALSISCKKINAIFNPELLSPILQTTISWGKRILQLLNRRPPRPNSFCINPGNRTLNNTPPSPVNEWDYHPISILAKRKPSDDELKKDSLVEGEHADKKQKT